MRIVFTIGYRVSSDFSCSTCPPLRFLLSLFITVSSSFCNSFFSPFSRFFVLFFWHCVNTNISHANLAPSDFQSRRKCLAFSLTFFLSLNLPIPFSYSKRPTTCAGRSKIKTKNSLSLAIAVYRPVQQVPRWRRTVREKVESA